MVVGFYSGSRPFRRDLAHTHIVAAQLLEEVTVVVQHNVAQQVPLVILCRFGLHRLVSILDQDLWIEARLQRNIDIDALAHKL